MSHEAFIIKQSKFFIGYASKKITQRKTMKINKNKLKTSLFVAIIALLLLNIFMVYKLISDKHNHNKSDVILKIK
jgi:hypothetical protein